MASDALSTSRVIKFSPSVVAFSFSVFANIAGAPDTGANLYSSLNSSLSWIPEARAVAVCIPVTAALRADEWMADPADGLTAELAVGSAALASAADALAVVVLLLATFDAAASPMFAADELAMLPRALRKGFEPSPALWRESVVKST